jgi:predicted membrane protein
MGSIVKFGRPRPVIRHTRLKIASERESLDARRSLFILIGAFFVTATVMCAAVVAMASSTWTDVLVMSAFVLVFALLKIALANALIYTMLRYDATTEDVPAQSMAIPGYARVSSIRQTPIINGRRSKSLKTNKLRVAIGIVRPSS